MAIRSKKEWHPLRAIENWVDAPSNELRSNGRVMLLLALGLGVTGLAAWAVIGTVTFCVDRGGEWNHITLLPLASPALGLVGWVLWPEREKAPVETTKERLDRLPQQYGEPSNYAAALEKARLTGHYTRADIQGIIDEAMHVQD